jgi:hypothetical protein
LLEEEALSLSLSDKEEADELIDSSLSVYTRQRAGKGLGSGFGRASVMP